MALSITSVARDGLTRLLVRGEVDVSCADELRDALCEAESSAPSAIEVDLAEVPYIDSTGIGVLVGAARRAAASSRDFCVMRPQRNVARVIGMLGLENELCLRDVSREQN